MMVLFTPTFAQEGDADGDRVLDSQDRCPREKGTKENKGCPGKNADANKKVVQAENPTDLGNPFADLCVSGNCVNGKGKRAYDIGDTYEGDWVAGKYHGKGNHAGVFSGIYEGDFVDGKRQGTDGRATF